MIWLNSRNVVVEIKGTISAAKKGAFRMSYQWSRNAAHIQSLFRPWKTGDGWDETSIKTAEQMLSVSFPSVLRGFYLSWGRRTDYTRSNDVLLDPKETFEHLGHLVFCIENQAVNFWGVPIHQLDERDPPVTISTMKKRILNGNPVKST